MEIWDWLLILRSDYLHATEACKLPINVRVGEAAGVCQAFKIQFLCQPAGSFWFHQLRPV